MPSKQEDLLEVKAAASIKGLVDQKTVYRDRMNICEKCDRFFRLTKQCKECGCFLSNPISKEKQLCGEHGGFKGYGESLPRGFKIE